MFDFLAWSGGCFGGSSLALGNGPRARSPGPRARGLGPGDLGPGAFGPVPGLGAGARNLLKMSCNTGKLPGVWLGKWPGVLARGPEVVGQLVDPGRQQKDATPPEHLLDDKMILSDKAKQQAILGNPHHGGVATHIRTVNNYLQHIKDIKRADNTMMSDDLRAHPHLCKFLKMFSPKR